MCTMQIMDNQSDLPHIRRPSRGVLVRLGVLTLASFISSCFVYFLIFYVDTSQVNQTNYSIHEETTNQVSDLFRAMDFSVNPCDDFYQFACGKWSESSRQLTTKSIRVIDSAKMTDMAEEILSSPMKSSDNKALILAKEFYSQCINLDEIEENGVKPLLLILEKYGGWPILLPKGAWKPSRAFDWIKIIGDLQRMNFPTLIKVDLDEIKEIEFKNISGQHVGSENTLSVHFIPPPSFIVQNVMAHLNSSKRNDHETLVSAYKTFIASAAEELVRAQREQPDSHRISQIVDSIIQFESALANISYGENPFMSLPQILNFKDLPNVQEIQNPITKAPYRIKMRWKDFINVVLSPKWFSMTHFKVIMGPPARFAKLVKLLSETSDETIANYLLWRVVYKLTSESNGAMRELNFQFQEKMTDIEMIVRRESDCATNAVHKFGNVLALEHFGPIPVAVHTHIDEMVKAIKDDVLSSIHYLGYETRMETTIIKQLEELTICIGLQHPLDSTIGLSNFYNGLALNESTYLQNYVRLTNWLFDANVRRFAKPFDPNCWGVADWSNLRAAFLTAYFDTERYAVHFPIGILQDPIYREGAPWYINYGSLGFIIAHEITHALRYAVSAYFTHHNDYLIEVDRCLADNYYDLASTFTDSDKNREIWARSKEHFADHTGLATAYEHAFGNGTEKTFSKETPIQEQQFHGFGKYTPGQLFFVSYANSWCFDDHIELDNEGNVSDRYHAPAKFRVMGTLQNSKYFSLEWKCPQNSPMNPPHKCDFVGI